jgi:hypothetical protein
MLKSMSRVPLLDKMNISDAQEFHYICSGHAPSQPDSKMSQADLALTSLML